MIDKDIIEAKFDIIERNLKFIREEYANKSAEEIEASYKDSQALKFSLFEIIEACIDIANHIISAERFERVEEYAKMFITLGKHGVISEELAEKLARMARFRNLLVHRYWEVDMKYIMEIVEHSLEDVEEFMVRIEEYVQKI
jgi:uncharacterized protein YutE (UPF0331/DUF86 family)